MNVDVTDLIGVWNDCHNAIDQDWSALTPTEVAILNHQIGQLKAAMQPIIAKQMDAARRLKGS